MKENKVSWVKPFLIILCAATVISIIVGAVYHLTSGIGLWRFGHTQTDTLRFDGESVQSLDIDLDIADLTIRYGEKFEVSYTFPKKYIPDISLKDGRLQITDNGQDFRIFSLGGFSFGNRKCSIDIVLPKETSISDIDMLLDMGSLELNQISCTGTISAQADMGNIELHGCTSKQIDAEADMGNIELDSCTFDTGNFAADMGNIEIDGIFKKIDAACSMGNITLDSDEPIDENALDLDCDMGHITVNGKKWR